MREIPIHILHERLTYNPETGLFIWNHTTQWTKKGHVAGTRSNGYITISINKTILRAHRIAWAMTYDAWPFGEIDHINGIRDDNRIINLREVTHQQNCFNMPTPATNKSGYKGVSWHKEGKKWQSHIQANKKHYYLGLFDTAEEAHEAYKEASKRLHGNFAKV